MELYISPEEMDIQGISDVDAGECGHYEKLSYVEKAALPSSWLQAGLESL